MDFVGVLKGLIGRESDSDADNPCSSLEVCKKNKAPSFVRATFFIRGRCVVFDDERELEGAVVAICSRGWGCSRK